MKRVFFLAFVFLILNSCTQEAFLEPEGYVVKSDVFETTLGSKSVFGLSLKIKSPDNKKEIKGIKVSLFQNEKVWIDTIFAELNGSDTLHSDVIFTQSSTLEKGGLTYKFESFDIES